MTYAELLAAIEAIVEKDDTELDAFLPTAISLAELRILRDVDLDVARKYATATLTGGSPFIAVPTDFVVARHLSMYPGNGDRSLLDRRHSSFIVDYWPDRSETDTTPRYWALWDNNTLIVAPTPTNNIDLELAYTYRPTGLSVSNTTSWLGDNAYDALLWAALIEVHIFLKGEQQALDAWTRQYEAAKTRLMVEQVRNRQDENRSGDPLRQNK